MKKRVIVMTLLVLATVALIFSVQSTFAKYKTSYTKTDNARVAKWGVNIEKSIDLFSSSYASGVASIDKSKIVAPGTEGEYVFTISGAPETNYKLRIDATGTDTIGRLEYDFDDMCPTTDIRELARCIQETFNRDIVYPANQPVDYDLETGEQWTHTISWRWLYEQGDLEDQKDTIKGKEAVIDKNDPKYSSQGMVTLSFKIVAEQAKEIADE